MRAFAIVARDEAAALCDLPDREPGPGEVRLVVEAVTVNGFDAAVAAGYVWDALPHDFPVVLGRDVAGTVESVGDEVEGIAVGDRVSGVIPGVGLGSHGTHAERFTISASEVVQVPSGVTPAQAAATGLAAVAALDAVTALDVQPDDVVLVSGATGGVGTFAVQLAAARGAKVLATARPSAASELVRELGAAEALEHEEDLAAAVRAVAPDGVTKVVHAAGDVAALASLLAPGGSLVSVLGADPAQAGRDDVTVGAVMAEPTAAKLTSLLESVAAGRLATTVSATYPFEELPAALTAFGTSKLGKLVVTVP